MGNLQTVEVAQQSAVARPQSEENCLLVPLELVDLVTIILAPSLLFHWD